VVSGLPASGKSTLAKLLGSELGFEVLDKHFEMAARTPRNVILVSHWRRFGDQLESGTPTDWLSEFSSVIEIACCCSTVTAVNRFTSRKRHPAHGDATKVASELLPWFEAENIKGPLGVGSLISVDTENFVDINKLAQECREFFQ